MPAYTLRPYQQHAVDAAIEWIRKSIEPCIIEAATGAGKSLIIADIAHKIYTASGGKHILALAPSAELIEQNREKYIATGNPASVYSASAGSKCLRHPVVFATPLTFKKVARLVAGRFALVIVDECHGITPTIQAIISVMRESNPNLRVMGTTATPYRMNTGYIYRLDDKNRAMGADRARNPYFTKLVYRITAHELLDLGYLTPPVIGDISVSPYDTLAMELNTLGQFKASDVDRAFVGHGRKTAAIVADVVQRCADRGSVMFFAATVAHAVEVMASLPAYLSVMVTGNTDKKTRRRAVHGFKTGDIKYLVNVGVFTTGFDVERVDVIALLRATESVGLLQQIIGRGLRLFPGKKDVLILDYAQNIVRHCPGGDVFSPQVKTNKAPGGGGEIEAECPSCLTKNIFSGRPNPDDYDVDDNGYFVDRLGQKIQGDYGAIPAHFGRRCFGMLNIGGGYLARCLYRWTFKKCEACGGENDIAARYCMDCKAELVNPNDKLIMEFKTLKKDPTRPQTDAVINMEKRETISAAGNLCMRVDFVTPYRRFSIWYLPSGTARQQSEYAKFTNTLESDEIISVTYRKDADSNFYKILAFNLPPDALPDGLAHMAKQKAGTHDTLSYT